MAIDFHCPSCGKLLRVPDDTVGKRAKCPQCSTISTIPAPSPAGELPPERPFDAVNPYRSPAASSPAAGGADVAPLDLNEAYGRTWTIFKSQWPMCLGILVVTIVISVVVGMIIGFFTSLMDVAMQGRHPFPAFGLLGNLVGQAFGLWLQIGLCLFFLKTARGRQGGFEDLFSGGRYFLRILGAYILYLLMVFAGLLAFIVPGIILALMFWPYFYVILDRDVGVIDSFSIAKDLTEGNKLTVFVIGLLAFLLGIVALIPCGMGLLVWCPYVALLWPVVYLLMSGQPTADQIRSVPSAARM